MPHTKDQPDQGHQSGNPSSGHFVAMRAMESANQFRSLAEGILALSAAQDEDGLYAILLDRASAILPTPHWALGRLIPGGNGLDVELAAVTPSVNQHFGSDLRGATMPVYGNGFSRKLYEERQIVFVPDASAAPEELEPSLTAHFGWRCLLGIPILQSGAAVGGLYAVSFANEVQLDPTEAQLVGLQNLARVAGLALERVRLWTQLQNELRQRKESEALYRALVEEALSGVYLIQDGLFQYCNPAFCEIFGYTEEELRGKPVGDLVTEGDRAAVIENVRKRVGGEMKAIHYTFMAQGKDRVIPVEVHGSAVQWEGRPAVLGVLLDISERLKSQEALNRSKDLSELLAQATHDLALAKDEEAFFETLFAAARRMSGLPMWWHNRFDITKGISITDHWVPEMETLGTPEELAEPMRIEDFELLKILHLAKEPVWIPRCKDHPAFPAEYLAAFPHQSAVLLPLLHQGASVGGLMGGTFAPDTERELSEDQINALKSLGAAAGVAISRLRTQQALRHSKELSELLAQATRELALARDEEELFGSLFAAARRMSDLPMWWHNRFDMAEGLSITDHWNAEMGERWSEEAIIEPMRIEDFPLIQVLHLAKEPVWIPHCANHPAFPPEYLEAIPHQSTILLPLLHQGESVGGLMGGTFAPDGERELSEDQIAALKGLGAAAGVAISRLRDHAAMEASEARYRQLFDQSADAILLGDADGYIQGNEAAARLFGIPQASIPGQRVGAFSPELQPGGVSSRDLGILHMKETLEGHTPVFPWMNQRADGTLVPTEIKMGLVVHEGRRLIQCVLRDVSEARRAEAEKADLQRQLFQAQKLESLGILAGGIAHDFNNLLTGILGHADLALVDARTDDPMHRHLEAVRKTALKASELTRQLLAYSGRGAFVLRKVDLSAMVDEIAQLLEVSIPKAVSLRLDLGRQLPPIEVDAAQMQQVIMNLVINAAEAMGGTEGTIRLSTGLESLDAEAIRGLQGGEPKPGSFVFLRVADTGCGMDEGTLARIFEPFFTTKFTGRGLGLSALLGIVRGHSGGLRVRSGAGEGTVFTVYLPASEGMAAAPETPAGVGRASEPGTGTLLVVDDDDMVRAVARQSLEMRGYTVIEACDGAEALEMVREYGARIRLVVLDATMPNLSGESALRELHAMLPDLPVLLSSGYAEGETLERFPDLGPANFLPKPYGPKDLLAKVRALL